VLAAQGDLPEALTSYRDSLAIMKPPGESDPGNAGWQRGLSLAYGEVGNVLVAHGHLPEARDHFTADRAVIAQLVQQSLPGANGNAISLV
jgi:hypothetical protein